MKKMLLIALIALMSVPVYAGDKGKGKGESSVEKEHPKHIICVTYNVINWKWCRGDWTNP